MQINLFSLFLLHELYWNESRGLANRFVIPLWIVHFNAVPWGILTIMQIYGDMGYGNADCLATVGGIEESFVVACQYIFIIVVFVISNIVISIINQ